LFLGILIVIPLGCAFCWTEFYSGCLVLLCCSAMLCLTLLCDVEVCCDWLCFIQYIGIKENSKVVKAFLVPPSEDVLPGEMLSREQLARKLTGFMADGASVNGVRRAGQAYTEGGGPYKGESIFNILVKIR
jgi:hypothetical protein